MSKKDKRLNHLERPYPEGLPPEGFPQPKKQFQVGIGGSKHPSMRKPRKLGSGVSFLLLFLVSVSLVVLSPTFLPESVYVPLSVGSVLSVISYGIWIRK